MKVVDASNTHHDGVMNILSQYFDKKFPNDLHVPVEDFLSDSNEPVGKICVGDDGTVLGMMGCYLCDDVSKMIEEQVNSSTKPSIRGIKDDKAIFLAYGYVCKEIQGSGVGTMLYEEMVELGRNRFGADAAYLEAWIHGGEIDGKDFAESKGFDVLFWPENYWSNSSYCSYHEASREYCDCQGALFRKAL